MAGKLLIPKVNMPTPVELFKNCDDHKLSIGLPSTRPPIDHSATNHHFRLRFVTPEIEFASAISNAKNEALSLQFRTQIQRSEQHFLKSKPNVRSRFLHAKSCSKMRFHRKPLAVTTRGHRVRAHRKYIILCVSAYLTASHTK